MNHGQVEMSSFSHQCFFIPILLLIQILAAYTKGTSCRDNTVQQHSIEIRVLVDKWAIIQWSTKLCQLQQHKCGKNTTQILSTMTQHVKAVVHGVNNIFAGVAMYGITLDLRIASLTFVTEEVVKETQPGSGSVAYGGVLHDFAWWLYNRSYSPVDHTLLLTGLNITGNSADADSVGTANVGAMCAPQSLSAVEFLPGGETVLVVAHELGHSLNVPHDGEGNVTCTSNSYVMDSFVNYNSTNNYFFSPCSAHSIKEFLGSPAGSCLNWESTNTGTDTEAPTIGYVMTVDELCQMILGPQSFFHRASYGSVTQSAYSTICTSVWCWKNDSFTEPVVTGDGFVCGDKKICHLGKCIYFDHAPSTSDTCPYGDPPQHSRVFGNMSCQSLVTLGNASLCYAEYYRRTCCGSCEAAYSHQEDCEFGDKASWCAPSQYPYVCNRNSNVCCASCLPYFNASRTGCEYGDKATWCATADYPHTCALNDEACCESCQQFFNASRRGCEYGDKATWCATTDYPSVCHLSADVCCESCQRFYNESRIGREYTHNASLSDDVTDDNKLCPVSSDVYSTSCSRKDQKDDPSEKRRERESRGMDTVIKDKEEL
ncbi:A disintegrin and metalloproteinase with thrombospondin motifs 1-like isoform X2 [Littorina saxatilis]|uniref:A disintegrin and metalloproteinase with thrombospondin motifs 1-like isoform X2 n=1 Tax=Littorina saxatilis TaxID=31220 RepID=UPI0038B504B1